MKDQANNPSKTPITKYNPNRNAPYDMVLIVGPDTPRVAELVQHYKKSGLSYCVIGDGKHSVSLEDVSQELTGKLGPNTRIDLSAHGSAMYGEHAMRLNAKPGSPVHPTADIFSTLKQCAGNMPTIGMQTHVWSCFGGASIKDAKQLPLDSFLIAHSNPNTISTMSACQEGIIAGIQHHKDGIGPLQEFAYNFRESPETVTITSTSIGKNGQPLHHTAKPIRISLLPNDASDLDLQKLCLDNGLGIYAGKLNNFNGAPERNTQLIEPIRQLPASKTYARDALCLAVGQGNVDYVTKYLTKAKNADPNFNPNSLRPELAHAYHKPTPIVRAFMKAGFDINRQDRHGRTILHSASSSRDGTALVEALLGAGARVDIKDKHGLTALHEAAAAGCRPTARILINAGADVHATTHVRDGNRSPLLMAVNHGKVETTSTLLNTGTWLHTSLADRAVIRIGATINRLLGKEGSKEVLERLKLQSDRHKVVKPLYNEIRKAVKQNPDLSGFYKAHKKQIKTSLYCLTNEQIDVLKPKEHQPFVDSCVDAMKQCMHQGLQPTYSTLWKVNKDAIIPKTLGRPLLAAPHSALDQPMLDDLPPATAKLPIPDRIPMLETPEGLRLPPHIARSAQEQAAALPQLNAPAQATLAEIRTQLVRQGMRPAANQEAPLPRLSLPGRQSQAVSPSL